MVGRPHLVPLRGRTILFALAVIVDPISEQETHSLGNGIRAPRRLFDCAIRMAQQLHIICVYRDRRTVCIIRLASKHRYSKRQRIALVANNRGSDTGSALCSGQDDANGSAHAHFVPNFRRTADFVCEANIGLSARPGARAQQLQSVSLAADIFSQA